MKVLVHAIYGDSITCQLRSGETPEIGREYHLEDARDGTGAQNRLFHKLVHLYYESGCFSDDAVDFYTLRQHILRRLGKGFEKYLFIDDKGYLQVVGRAEDLPGYVIADPEKRNHVRAQLYSWTGYSLKARRSTIKALIAEMIHTGVSSKEFEEILQEFHDG